MQLREGLFLSTIFIANGPAIHKRVLASRAKANVDRLLNMEAEHHAEKEKDHAQR